MKRTALCMALMAVFSTYATAQEAALVGKVTIEGDGPFHSVDNIRGSLPALKEGQPLDLDRLAANLRSADESASKKTTVVLKKDMEATIRVTESNPFRVGVSMDNTGTKATGYGRVGVGVIHSNLFDKDHQISAQYITSPDHLSDVKIFGAGYRIPLYDFAGSVEAIYGYSDVNSGRVNTAAGAYNIAGSGQFVSLRFNRFLSAWGGWSHKLSAGVEYKAFSNKVTFGEDNISLVPDVTSHPLVLSYAGAGRLGGGEMNLTLSLSQNFAGGKNGSNDDFAKSRAGAKADFTAVRFSAAYTKGLPANFLLSSRVAGQYSNDALISGEQFGLGGVNSVRGFKEREIAMDKGVSAQVEVQSPIFTQQKLAELQTRAVVFFDAGQGWRNNALQGETKEQTIASYGVGVRAQAAKNTSVRFDLAQVVKGGGDQKKGDVMAHAAINITF